MSELSAHRTAVVAQVTTRWRWAAAVVLVLTAMLYFVGLGTRALWASEFRWGEVAREMLLTHNYFWPTINGRVYFDKPLGSYWLVIASTWLTGRMDEAAARIPSAVAGLLAVALLILLTRRLYDLRTGVIAGFILATSFSFAFWSRTASADVETIAGELAALLMFKRSEDQPGWWLVAMWLVMAATSLLKGLLGFVLPIMVVGVYSVSADGWRELVQRILYGPLPLRIRWLVDRNRWFFNWRTFIAMTSAAVIYCAPFVISFAQSGSARGLYMVYRENVERYFAPFDHRGPIYLYLYVIFALMAPWSAFLPAAVIRAHRPRTPRDENQRSERFVLAFFWTTFVFFTVSGSRRSYYILPILPPAAILIARCFTAEEDELSESVRRSLNIGYALIFAGAALSVVALRPPKFLLPKRYAFLPMLPHPAVFAVCWAVAMTAAAYPLLRYNRQRVVLSVCTISYLLMFYVFVIAMPAGDRWRPEKSFAEQSRQIIGEHQSDLASFKTQPPVFYLGLTRPVPEYDDPAQLESAVQSGHVKWIFSRRRDLTAFKFETHVTASEETYPWDSREHRLNSLVLMEAHPSS